jgi:hypothetical protein
VVRAGTNPRGGLEGVSAALVSVVRGLRSKVKLNNSEEVVRSFCVLDYVLEGDYDSHATIHYGERTSDGLSQKQISTIRTAAQLDLADAFGPILSVIDIEFAVL